jgi:hypothetical protein
MILALTVLAADFWKTSETAVFGDAKVTSIERMCVPYDLHNTGRRNGLRRVHPPGWTDFGRPCSEKSAIMKVRYDGFWNIDSYWNAAVTITLADGEILRGKITTRNQPLVVFKSGSLRDSNATKGLKPKPLQWSAPTKLIGERVEIGDSLPVVYNPENPTDLVYAPNELVYTQYTWILLGCAVLLGIMLLLFMPDGAPQTEEGRRYVQQIREKYWDGYGGYNG